MGDTISNTQLAIWNMDEARLKSINDRMERCANALDNWQLEEIFFSILSLRREIAGKLTQTQLDSLNKDIEKLNEYRKNKLNKQDANEVCQYWVLADKIYIDMNRLGKEHGWYFREGKDPRKAVVNN
jgi:hypothetical protein